MDKRESLTDTLRRMLDEIDITLADLESGMYLLQEIAARPASPKEWELISIMTPEGIGKIVGCLLMKAEEQWASWVYRETLEDVSIGLYSLIYLELISRQSRCLERAGKGKEAAELISEVTFPPMTHAGLDVKA